MNKLIKTIVGNNPTLDGAECITTTVTREDGSKTHYYIFKGSEKDTDYVEIPLWVYTKINGKGRNSHFITVQVNEHGYVVHDLNKEHTVKPISMKTLGLPIDEAEEVYKFQEVVV